MTENRIYNLSLSTHGDNTCNCRVQYSCQAACIQCFQGEHTHGAFCCKAIATTWLYRTLLYQSINAIKFGINDYSTNQSNTNNQLSTKLLSIKTFILFTRFEF